MTAAIFARTTTWRAPYLDLASGPFIPCVVTWNPENGGFTRVEGPRGFETWEQAEEAKRFLGCLPGTEHDPRGQKEDGR